MLTPARASGPIGASRNRYLTVLVGGIALLGAAFAPASAPAQAASNHRYAHLAGRRPRALIAAARSTHNADRALVLAARRLAACQPRRAGGCAAERRRLQRAGTNLSRAERRLSRAAADTVSAAGAGGALQAPQISVSGETVSWSTVAGAEGYVLARILPGGTTSYSLLDATATTPPPLPGATVRYRVRAAAAASSWSQSVAVYYPAPGAPEAPAAQTDRQAAPALSASGLQLGWSQVADVTTYVLATTVPGRQTSYSEVTGTAATPAALPGQTADYSVRTAVEGSAWSPEVAITYPAETPGSEASGEAQPAGEPFIKGINTNLQGWGTSAIPEIASEMSDLGVSWAREDLAWSTVEPEPGVFNWSSFDQLVAAARANGITILPIVGYAPSWTSPENSSAYAEFVARAVQRYGPGTAANLQWWELWNEPNEPYAWSGKTPSAEGYARDVAAAAEAAKAIAPSVKVLAAAEYNDSPQTGGSTPWETSWVDDMFRAVPDLGSLIDGVSVHPYAGDPLLPIAKPGGWTDTSGQWAFQRIDTIHAEFLAHGVNLPFWITEDGWSTRDVSEATQQKYYGDLVTAIAERPWVRALFPYCLREFQAQPTNDQSEYGLLKFGTWAPKPAFYTLKADLGKLG